MPDVVEAIVVHGENEWWIVFFSSTRVDECIANRNDPMFADLRLETRDCDSLVADG
jgi:hypothetical protein